MPYRISYAQVDENAADNQHYQALPGKESKSHFYAKHGYTSNLL